MKWSFVLLFIALGCVAVWAVPARLFRSEEAATTPSTQPPPAAEVVLDRAKQERIWELEHITFEIETHFGKPFAQRLAARQADRLQAYFHQSCPAEVLTPGRAEERQVGIVTEVRRRAEQSGTATATAGELVARLVATLGEFKDVARARLRILKIEQAEDLADAWQTHVLLTAHGSGRQGELLVWESEHEVLFQYQDQQQLQDGPTVAAWKWTAQDHRRSQGPLMEEATMQSGLDRIDLMDNWELPVDQQGARNFQMAVEDYDRDGFLDIAIATTGSKRPYLLRSLAGRSFEDRAESLGLKTWSKHSSLVAWIDYDNDGYPDLLMGDRLYRNVGGQRFADVTPVSGLTFDYEPAGATVVDYDCDGLLDLYVLYEIPLSRVTEKAADKPSPWVGDEQSGAINRLWHNEGGRFRDVTHRAASGGGKRQTFAAAWLFYDDDHFPDVYVANDFGENVLLRNRGDGTFEDVTKSANCGDFATSMGVSSGDIDNDGQAEIYVANMFSKMGRRILANVDASDYPQGIYEQLLGACAGNRLYTRPVGQQQFRETSADLGINGVGWAFAPTMTDFDGDGWLDLYATTGFRSYDRAKPDG